MASFRLNREFFVRFLPLLTLAGIGLGLSVWVQAFGVPYLRGTPTDVQGPLSLVARLDVVRDQANIPHDIPMFGASTVLGKAARAQGDAAWRDHTLPASLQKELGSPQKVHNLGFDGALPADFLIMSRQLESLKPKTVLATLSLRHLSRDFDAPTTGYSRPFLPHFRLRSDGWLESSGYATSGVLSVESWLQRMGANLYPPFRYQEALQSALLGDSTTVAAANAGRKVLASDEDDSFMLLLKQKQRFDSVEVKGDHYQIRALREFVRLWRERGAKVLVFPAQDNPDSLPDLVDEGRYQTQLAELERLLKPSGAIFVRTDGLSPASEFIDTTHLTAEGNARLARRLVEAMAQSDLPAVPLPEKANLEVPPAPVTTAPFGLTSLFFFLLVALLAAAFVVVRAPRARHALYLLASFAWLASFPWSLASLLLFTTFLAFGYFGAQGFLKGWIPRSRWTLAGILVVETVLFVLLNQYTGISGAWSSLLPESPILRVVGISYVFFRTVHVLVDAASGDIAEIDPVKYLSYQLGFLTLLAGPIALFPAFSKNWEETVTLSPRLSFDQTLTALLRVAWGFFKKLVLAALLFEWIRLTPDVSTATTRQLVAHFYGYALYVFFDFSGYTDIVIGMGRLVGLRLPENFRLPFLSPDPASLWKRWHMSFTSWLETYLFNPALRFLTKRTKGKRPLLSFGLAYFAVFFLAGVWHGTVPIMLWGMVTAFAIVLLKVLDHYLKRLFGKARWEALKNRPAVTFVGTLLTFHFICYSFSLIGLSYGDLWTYHLRLLGLF